MAAPALAKDVAKRDPHWEVFAGGTVADRTWIGWSGAVTSFGGDLYGSGPRLRAVACHGSYGYETEAGVVLASPLLVEVTPGYQLRQGGLFAKLFAGLQAEQIKRSGAGAGSGNAPVVYGAKLVSETWLDLPFRSFASLDASFASHDRVYQGRLRLGSAYVLPQLGLGGEVGLIGNGAASELRFGGVARAVLFGSEIEVSGGYALADEQPAAPYFGLSLLQRY